MSFETDAMRTASTNFYTDRADFFEVRSFFKDAIAAGERANFYKKALFHGSRGESYPGNSETWPAHLLEHRDLIHGALGLYSEAGEILESVLHGLFTDLTKVNMDEVNLKEEVGDSMWYLAMLSTYGEFTMSEAGQAIIEKLKARYPDKFSTENCLNRNVDAERKILEAN